MAAFASNLIATATHLLVVVNHLKLLYVADLEAI